MRRFLEAAKIRAGPNQSGPLPSVRAGLDCYAVAARAGWKAGEIRSKTFRHTYCAARLQTVDQGAPVSMYTVAKEMDMAAK